MSRVDDLALPTGGSQAFAEPRQPRVSARARREKQDGDRLRKVRRTYWIAFFSNISKAVFKLIVALLGYNSLFVLDGLVSAAIGTQYATALIGLNMSETRFYSPRYSYGKGKIQFMLALLLGGILVVAAALALGLTIKRFAWPVRVSSSPFAISMALISTAANLLIMFYVRHSAQSTFDVGMRKMASMQALGVFSAMSVLQSTVLIGFNWYNAERIGRICIAMIMLYLSVVIIRNALEGVMDRSTGDETEGLIADLTRSVKGVVQVNAVRTRRVGELIHIDIEVALSAKSTIAESDHIAGRIKKLLAQRIEQPEHAITVFYCTA